jgi:hypothetical protein
MKAKPSLLPARISLHSTTKRLLANAGRLRQRASIATVFGRVVADYHTHGFAPRSLRFDRIEAAD